MAGEFLSSAVGGLHQSKPAGIWEHMADAKFQVQLPWRKQTQHFLVAVCPMHLSNKA